MEIEQRDVTRQKLAISSMPQMSLEEINAEIKASKDALEEEKEYAVLLIDLTLRKEKSTALT